ncbi:WD repeat-containing protein AAC3 [Porphyridium purpureum]|uniref:WD repeat-containing protein AAC3 n=1 Tax=Porphyridium purpureum TaxID=35688 RepID=A0A5J4YXP4_PORPP|nr:WD repeat-containing protein AAC3 [Porphyridium purpureum]|eukprot:POR9305..scf208_2
MSPVLAQSGVKRYEHVAHRTSERMMALGMRDGGVEGMRRASDGWEVGRAFEGSKMMELVAWNASGSLLAFVPKLDAICIIDPNTLDPVVASFKPLTAPDGNKLNVHAIAWSPKNDQQMALATQKGIYLVTVEEMAHEVAAKVSSIYTPVFEYWGKSGSRTDQMVWSPSGKWLMARTLGEELAIFNMESMTRAFCTTYKHVLHSFCWDEAHERCYLGIKDGSSEHGAAVDALSLDTFSRLPEFPKRAHRDSIWDMKLRPSGQGRDRTGEALLATVSKDTTAFLWDTEHCDTVRLVQLTDHGLRRVDWDHSGNLLALASNEDIILVDAVTGEAIRSWQLPKNHRVKSIAWHPRLDILAYVLNPIADRDAAQKPVGRCELLAAPDCMPRRARMWMQQPHSSPESSAGAGMPPFSGPAAAPSLQDQVAAAPSGGVTPGVKNRFKRARTGNVRTTAEMWSK